MLSRDGMLIEILLFKAEHHGSGSPERSRFVSPCIHI